MLLFLFGIVLAFTLPKSGEAFGLVDRRESLSRIASSIWLPSILVAESSPDLAPLDFSGVYRDPKHPKGYRVVRTDGPGLVSVIVQDDSDGPTLKISGTSAYDPITRKTSLQLEVTKKGEKGYILPSIYSPDQLLYVNFCEGGQVLTRGSITFPDGNVWVKEDGLQGVYIDSREPEGYRVVRQLGNAKVSIEVASRVDQIPTTLPAVINKSEGSLVIDFSPLSGPKRLSVEIEGNQLLFPDGSTWTKL